MSYTYSEEYLRDYHEAVSAIRTNPKLALEQIHALFPEAAENGDTELMAELFFGAGSAAFMLSESDRGMGYLRGAIHFFRKLNNQLMVSKALSFVGILQLHQGDLAGAIESFSGNLEIAKADQDHVSIFKAYSQLGQAFRLIQNLGESNSYFLKGYEVLHDHPVIKELTEAVPIFYSGLAETYVAMHDFENAQKIIDEMESEMYRYPRFIESPFELWPQYCLAFETGDPAAEELEERLWKTSTDKTHINTDYLISMSRFLEEEYRLGKYEHAIELADIMMEFLQHSDLHRRKMAVIKVRIQACQALGRYEEMRQATNDFFVYQEAAEKYSAQALISFMQLRQENNRLFDKARTDELTGIYNRRALNEIGMQMYEEAYRDRHLYGYEMLDIDLFKQINDQYGHEEGDRALKVICNVLQRIAAPGIVPARYGGDEFAVIYLNVTKDEILKTAVRIREEIRKEIENGACIPMTVSQGIFCMLPHPYLKEWEYRSKADKALYKSKVARQGIVHLHTETEEMTA